MRRKLAYLKRTYFNTITLPSFIITGNSITKNRVVMVCKGYHNVFYFSIISNFYNSMYPDYYLPRYIQIRLGLELR